MTNPNRYCVTKRGGKQTQHPVFVACLEADFLSPVMDVMDAPPLPGHGNETLSSGGIMHCFYSQPADSVPWGFRRRRARLISIPFGGISSDGYSRSGKPFRRRQWMAGNSGFHHHHTHTHAPGIGTVHKGTSCFRLHTDGNYRYFLHRHLTRGEDPTDI
jgi:hypothetical protein